MGQVKSNPNPRVSPMAVINKTCSLMAGVLDRLRDGEVIVGDGSYVFTLEKRGYVLAGKYTPEAACEHPEAVKQLAVEYARAGADVTQTFTYGSTKQILEGCEFTPLQI